MRGSPTAAEDWADRVVRRTVRKRRVSTLDELEHPKRKKTHADGLLELKRLQYAQMSAEQLDAEEERLRDLVSGRPSSSTVVNLIGIGKRSNVTVKVDADTKWKGKKPMRKRSDVRLQ